MEEIDNFALTEREVALLQATKLMGHVYECLQTSFHFDEMEGFVKAVRGVNTELSRMFDAEYFEPVFKEGK